MRRFDSKSSLISNVTDADSVDTSVSRARNMSKYALFLAYKVQLWISFIIKDSPADLHGMWYPTVRRTLVCLSRLYRCVDRPIFQGLSQEALKLCIQSVSAAAAKISKLKVI